MEQDKFKFDNPHKNLKKEKNFGIWTLVVSIVVAFGFGYGVGFVSSAYFRNININKELSKNIQILQANNTSVKEEQTPKPTVVTNQAKISIKTNNTNATESEVRAIANSLVNQTNSTKTFNSQSSKNTTEQQPTTQIKTKTQEIKTNNHPVKTKGKYVVQVASFPDRSKALNLVISLIQKGFNASSEQTIINNVAYTRVIIEAHSLSEANKIATTLKADGITNMPIIYEKKQ